MQEKWASLPSIPPPFFSLRPMQAGFNCASRKSSQASSDRGIQEQPQICRYFKGWKTCNVLLDQAILHIGGFKWQQEVNSLKTQAH